MSPEIAAITSVIISLLTAIGFVGKVIIDARTAKSTGGRDDATAMQTLQAMLNQAMLDIQTLQTRVEEKDNTLRVQLDITTPHSDPRTANVTVRKLPRMNGRDASAPAIK